MTNAFLLKSEVELACIEHCQIILMILLATTTNIIKIIIISIVIIHIIIQNYLKRIVSARMVGFVNFAKTIPAIQACGQVVGSRC